MPRDRSQQIVISLEARDTRVEGVATRMVLRSDVFQAGLTGRDLIFATLAGAVVVLNAARASG